MKCPICNVDLVMSERQGIEIDYCPQCRGVWLDRGELDKIIDRSESQVDSYQQRGQQSRSYDDHKDSHRDRGYDEGRRDRGYDDRYRDKDYKGHKKKNPASFLGDLFEFGD